MASSVVRYILSLLAEFALAERCWQIDGGVVGETTIISSQFETA